MNQNQNQNQNLYLLRLHNKHFANILHYDKDKNTYTYIYKRLTSDKIPTGTSPCIIQTVEVI